MALLVTATVTLASCGGSPAQHPSASVSASSGVYGITLINQGGYMTAAPTPPPLPNGFGASVLVPCPGTVALIKVARGQDAGQIIARGRSDAQGTFRVAHLQTIADPDRRARVEDHKTAMLAELRHELDLTQAVIAERLEVTQENVSQIERGEADVRLSTSCLEGRDRAVAVRLSSRPDHLARLK